MNKDKKSKERKIPVSPIMEEDSLIDTCKAVSASDCTGLMQRTQLDKDELESYKDIYDYGPTAYEDME